MSIKLKSLIFVVVQFSSIIYLTLTTKLQANFVSIFIIILGILLALWAVWLMRNSGLSVFPEPNPQIKLIKIGPYRYIRHPMYTSLFLVLIPLVISDYSVMRTIIFLIFTVNQILKLLYEEKFLKQKLPEYKIYMSKSWRLIPFLF